MRKLFIYMVMLSLCACEVINEADRLIPMPLPESSQHQHVLLEFTGFRCVNCPAAEEAASKLQHLYGSQLIVVALHPASNPFTQGKYDYTCPEADSLYRFMGGTASTPFPTGNIDIVYTAEGYFLDPIDWAAQLQTVIADTVAPYLSVSAHMDTVKREMHVTPLYTANDDLQLSYWLVEDSVLGVQAMPDGSVNMNYYHRHVLRAISEQTTFSVPDKCRAKYCSVVAVLYDKLDKHILNAYETIPDFSTDY